MQQCVSSLLLCGLYILHVCNNAPEYVHTLHAGARVADMQRPQFVVSNGQRCRRKSPASKHTSHASEKQHVHAMPLMPCACACQGSASYTHMCVHVCVCVCVGVCVCVCACVCVHRRATPDGTQPLGYRSSPMRAGEYPSFFLAVCVCERDRECVCVHT